MSRSTVARIDLAALRHNLQQVKSMAPSSRVACVVKADAYGHGIRTVSQALEQADLLAVATVGEVQAVRDNGWTGRLLLMEGFSGNDELNAVNQDAAEYVLHHESQLQLLERRQEKVTRPVWVKVDTGMHRLGFAPEDVPTVLQRLRSICGERAPIMMTHFACADESESTKTRGQLNIFNSVVEGLSAERSLANSAAVLNYPEAHGDYVRPGIMLYGVSPCAGKTGSDLGLKPVMTLGCRLLSTINCKAGETVGYGARYVCPQDMRIGVAGIGYGDGYPRAVDDGTPVILNGRRAKLAGRVSMDLITIDLSDHDDAQVGDCVTLWGGDLPVEEIAAHANAIPYELICGVTGRVRRQTV